jgi:hypothetical protein
MDPLLRPSTEGPNGNALCKSCSNINLQDLKSGRGYEHQPTYGSILLNAPTCALCDLIAKSVERTLQRNYAFKPSISDSCGPVRLACAGRSLAQQSGLRSCPEGPVDESLLWREISILIGDNSMRERSFSTFGAQLVMVATKGKYQFYACYTSPGLIAAKTRLRKRLVYKGSNQTVTSLSRETMSKVYIDCCRIAVRDIAIVHWAFWKGSAPGTMGSMGILACLVD